MRFLLLRLFVFTFGCFFIVTNVYAEGCKMPIVTGSKAWYPFSYYDGERIKGIGPEVVALVLNEMELPMMFRSNLPWRRATEELTQGKIDILASNYWTEKRASKWRMTREIAIEPLRIFTLKDRTFPFKHWHDLKGKRGVVTRGIALGKEFEQYKKNINLLPVGNHDQGFSMINHDRADYLIIAEHSAIPYLRKQENSEITMLAQPINYYSVRIAFSKQSPCSTIFNEFEQTLQNKIDDGSVQRIVDKYFSMP